MQHLHNLIARLYPSWPRDLSGNRVHIHLADVGTWLHVDSDGGLDSPVKPGAVHHLHVSGEWTTADGTQRRPVVCMSVVGEVDARGMLAITPQALPWSYVVTAWTADAEDTASMRRCWTRAPSGRLVCRRNAVATGLRLVREWDEQIGSQWRP